MLYLESKDQIIYLFNGRFLVGRKHSDENGIQIDDKSLSREHCEIETKDGKSFIKDLDSKYGTFINQVKSKSKELAKNDIVKLGIFSTIYVVKECEFAIATSGLKIKTVLEEQIKKKGIILTNSIKRCTVLIMEKITITCKLLEALCLNKYIVTIEWLTDTQFIKKPEASYIPPYDNSTWTKNTFLPDVKRKTIFKNKSFILNQTQVETVGPAIEKAGGIVLKNNCKCVDSCECDINGFEYEFFCKCTNLDCVSPHFYVLDKRITRFFCHMIAQESIVKAILFVDFHTFCIGSPFVDNFSSGKKNHLIEKANVKRLESTILLHTCRSEFKAPNLKENRRENIQDEVIPVTPALKYHTNDNGRDLTKALFGNFPMASRKRELLEEVSLPKTRRSKRIKSPEKQQLSAELPSIRSSISSTARQKTKIDSAKKTSSVAENVNSNAPIIKPTDKSSGDIFDLLLDESISNDKSLITQSIVDSVNGAGISRVQKFKSQEYCVRFPTNDNVEVVDITGLDGTDESKNCTAPKTQLTDESKNCTAPKTQLTDDVECSNLDDLLDTLMDYPAPVQPATLIEEISIVATNAPIMIETENQINSHTVSSPTPFLQSTVCGETDAHVDDIPQKETIPTPPVPCSAENEDESMQHLKIKKVSLVVTNHTKPLKTGDTSVPNYKKFRAKYNRRRKPIDLKAFRHKANTTALHDISSDIEYENRNEKAVEEPAVDYIDSDFDVEQ
jgi:hypothetical protein